MALNCEEQVATRKLVLSWACVRRRSPGQTVPSIALHRHSMLNGIVIDLEITSGMVLVRPR